MGKKSKQGLTVNKEDDFTEWFTQLMQKAELADYTKVSGCVVYRPRAYELWEKIKEKTDVEFKKIGIQNAYFPMFIPESLLTKEAEHVEGFAPEVAWVTHSGSTKLGERLAVRPTSEAIMYDSYSNWIRSWRDLPLLLNQWNNVVRWEFNNPVPFFRAREFLWNEGHTVFATKKEAITHGEKVMKAYNYITEELLAIPGIYGTKTESEKFAGAVFTKKVHSYLPNGRIMEGTCFHYDGTNFAKAYDISFKDKDDKEKLVHQNTHALSVRVLGAMLAIHSDNNGLVIPPRIAINKVVVVPLLFKDSKKEVLAAAKKIQKELSEFNPILDERDDVSPGRKFNDWELKGIPIRVELGPRDLENNEAVLGIRHNGKKITVKLDEIKSKLPKLLEDMQKDLYNAAKKLLDNNQKKTEKKSELIKHIKNKQMVKIPLCTSEECEAQIKADAAGTKILYIDPENESVEGKKCINCGCKADYWVYAGRTY